MVLARGKPINIFEQKAGEDIAEPRDERVKMFNAPYRNAFNLWNVKDSDGNVVIPYRIKGHFERTSERENISTAMKRIEDNTCIRFRKRTNERDFIEIHNKFGEGCYANVGRYKGKSVVMLESNDNNTCVRIEIVLHELIHVIGLWHEHQRHDRDKYVKVHYKNVDKRYLDAFYKVYGTSYNLPYDYKSIMHYGKSRHAKLGKISLETLDPQYQDEIGNQTDASSIDYLKICAAYRCKRCLSKKIYSVINVGDNGGEYGG
ncbi:hypothetical protein RB195_007156 [Necator americanus]